MNEDKGRQRLGRGLASLIGGSTSSALPPRSGTSFPGPAMAREPQVGERRVAPGELRPNPKNPRRHFDETELGELTASVRQHGVVQPILVRKVEGEGGFEIVAGERRWRAAKAAGLKDVPVVLREISDRQALEIAIVENVQRADLNAIDEAAGYEQLMAQFSYTQEKLAEVIGKSRSHIANTLRLMKLPEAVKAHVLNGALTAGHARALLALPDPEAAAKRVVNKGLSVRDVEAMARAPEIKSAGAPRVAKPERDADTVALETELAAALGLDVALATRGAGGTLTIRFTDLEQLDMLARKLRA